MAGSDNNDINELLVKLLGSLGVTGTNTLAQNKSNTICVPTVSPLAQNHVTPMAYTTIVSSPNVTYVGPNGTAPSYQLINVIQPAANSPVLGLTPTTVHPGTMSSTGTTGHETILPHTFTAGTLHDLTIGAWNMDTVTTPSPIPHAFLVSQHTWHQRLGHPGGEVLRRLVYSNFNSYNKDKPPVLCHACQLGKHVRLSFVSSSTVISSCFDIFTWMCGLHPFRVFQGTDTAYLLLYVDDILLTASSESLLQQIIRSLHQEFAMTHLGLLNYNLVQQLFSSSTIDLVAYSDADWAGCPTTRRSTSGYCYRGVANVVAETCWLCNLLCELHTPLSSAMLVYCDNVSAFYLSCNPVQHQHMKHIEIDIHFVHDLVAASQLRVLHVPSRYQFVDIFTKGLPSALFEEFRSSLSARCPPAPTAGEC
ncbi:ribonuclease H-like domain-containing protein [Tanacetum coccineum]